MTARRPTVRTLVLFAAAVAALTPAARADPAITPATASPSADGQPFVGQIAGDDVLVRSGPSENFYATQKLNKGDRVTVVAVRGAAGEWLKIVPPDGSFCYVAQAYVDRVPGSDTAGRVKKPELNVRAGSLLNGLKKTRLMTLDTGDAVQILGVQDDYFKIAPPPGAYLYVQRSLVTPVPQAAPVMIPRTAQANDREPLSSDPVLPGRATVTPPAPTPPALVAAQPTPAPVPVVGPAVIPAPPVASGPLVPATPMIPATPANPPVAPSVSMTAAPTAAPTARPADGPDSAALASASVASAGVANPGVAAPATTEPSAGLVVSAAPVRPTPTTRPTLSPGEQFDRAEAEFARISRPPLNRQPIDPLLWRYKTLASSAALPSSLRQVAAARVATLELRRDGRRQAADAARLAADSAARQQALAAEQQELAQRIRDQQVTTYAAVGTLRVSSLQQAGPTLYRLTDPNTGRTVIYLRTNDPKYAGLLNQFVGVHGLITDDTSMNLKYVTPTDVAAVDPAKVNNGIAAAVSPPSLINRNATASTAGN